MDIENNGHEIQEVTEDNEWVFNLVNKVLKNLEDKYCTKCGNKIRTGSVFSGKKNDCLCETCLKIVNPYDNPEKYRYFWGGQYLSLDELPDIAKQYFHTLRK